MLGQLFGAFFGLALVWILVYDPIVNAVGDDWKREPNVRDVFHPLNDPTNWQVEMLDALLGSFILGMLTMAISDQGNMGVRYLNPLWYGFIIMVVGLAFSGRQGVNVNPAIEVASRLYSCTLGIFWRTSDWWMVILTLLWQFLGTLVGVHTYAYIFCKYPHYLLY